MKQWMMAAALAWSVMSVSAQHEISVDFDTRVAGPNSNFTMALTLNPPDIEVTGLGIAVHYDSSQVEFLGVTDNTGQPFAGVFYTWGNPVASSAFPNTNTFVNVAMGTQITDLVNPTNLALIHFKAKPEFSDPDNRVWISMQGFGTQPGLLVPDPTWMWIPIPTTYNNRSTPVPVTLSGFSLE